MSLEGCKIFLKKDLLLLIKLGNVSLCFILDAFHVAGKGLTLPELDERFTAKWNQQNPDLKWHSWCPDRKFPYSIGVPLLGDRALPRGLFSQILYESPA